MPDRRAKLTFVTPSLSGGGAEKFTVTLANLLAARGYDVALLSVKQGGPNKALLNNLVRYQTLNKRKVSSSIPDLCGYMRKNRDRVYISNIGHMNIGLILAKLLTRSRSKIIIREANVFSVNSKRLGLFKQRIIAILYRMLYPYADTVVCVSNCVRDDLADHLGLARENLTTIYNTVGVTRSAGTVHPWLKDGGAPVVIWIGRLEKQKDPLTAIKAFRKAVLREPCRMLMLGKGSLQLDLETEINNLGLGGAIQLCGFVDNPIDYLKRGHVYLLTSRNEGMPGSMVQALMCDIKIVSTDCRCGPAEILDGGRLGWLAPVDDVDELGKAIVQALRQRPEPLDGLRYSQRTRFEEEEIVNRWITLVSEG